MKLSDVAAVLTAIAAIIAISGFIAGVWGPQPPTPVPTPVQTSTPLYLPYTPPPINNPPAAFIDYINPRPALQGQSVRFTCHGDDPDSGDYITEYRWESSIDGFLSDQKTFSTSSLSSGSHQIILQIKDSHEQWSSEITRNLKVEATVPTPTPFYPTYTPPPINNPPAAFIDSINPSPALQGQSVTFTCHGDDPDSGDYITEYNWKSSIDGFLSDQKTFSTSSLTSGSHQIILRVKDSHEQWSSEITRNLKVEAIKIFVPSAEIKDVWVEHNVWEDNLKGMRIHVSFDINNLKGVNCRAIAYFYFKNGTALRDFNQNYYTTKGKVSSRTDFKPGYVSTTFSDLRIFLPYEELHMAPGKHDLKFYVSLWDENTELDPSNWVYFTYNR